MASSSMMRTLRAKAPVAVFSMFLGGAVYAVYYAHHQQRAEKQVMRAGVIRDIKRDRQRQRELLETAQQSEDRRSSTSATTA